MKKQLTAWLSIGSTYTYLTALRLEQVLAKHDVDLLVKPISIRSIMISTSILVLARAVLLY